LLFCFSMTRNLQAEDYPFQVSTNFGTGSEAKLQMNKKMRNDFRKPQLLRSIGPYQLEKWVKPESDTPKKISTISIPNGIAPCEIDPTEMQMNKRSDLYYERNMTGKQIIEEEARSDAFWENHRTVPKWKPKCQYQI